MYTRLEVTAKRLFDERKPDSKTAPVNSHAIEWLLENKASFTGGLPSRETLRAFGKDCHLEGFEFKYLEADDADDASQPDFALKASGKFVRFEGYTVSSKDKNDKPIVTKHSRGHWLVAIGDSEEQEIKADGTQKGEYNLGLGFAHMLPHVYQIIHPLEAKPASQHTGETKASLKSSNEALLAFNARIAELTASLTAALTAKNLEAIGAIADEQAAMQSTGFEAWYSASKPASQPDATTEASPQASQPEIPPTPKKREAKPASQPAR
jgi:hypothetical protein